MDNKIEITVEQLRELIQLPADILIKQDEILKGLKEIKEKLDNKDVPNIIWPYTLPYQPYTCPSNPTPYQPTVWYTIATPQWKYETTLTTDTKQILND